MLKSYFEIIRFAISQNRKKHSGIYYEAHHVVPQSFKKKSSIVLLTPEEHYKAHKILAEVFKNHTLYAQKMLWAFHRMTYNNSNRLLTESDYKEAREILMPLWKRKRTDSFKLAMKEKMKGNKNGINGRRGHITTEEQRKRYSISATKSKIGKIGEESRASKGSVVCENIESGHKIEAGSALQLSKQIPLHFSVIHEVLNTTIKKSPASKYYNFLQNHKIYYK